MVFRLLYKCRGCGEVYTETLRTPKDIYVLASEFARDPYKAFGVHQCEDKEDDTPIEESQVLGISDLVKIRPNED